ncbi:MAG: 50S ribosomal protein L29 [Dehalococcoidia bacterium]
MAKNNPKSQELVALDDARLAKELEDTYRQLFTLRLQVATRQLQNVKTIGETKRKIARIKTIQRQRELVAAGGGR